MKLSESEEMTAFFVMMFSSLPFKWIPLKVEATDCGDSITETANKTNKQTKRQQLKTLSIQLSKYTQAQTLSQETKTCLIQKRITELLKQTSK